MEMKHDAIGIIHSPFTRPEEIPKEKGYDPHMFETTAGEIEIYSQYREGLKDIDGFSHLIVLFSFHKSEKIHLTAHPPFDGKPRGVFATRSPHRPNLIGMTVVELIERKGNILKVRGVDMIEGTPVLDIKPYTERDQKKDISLGWIASATEESVKKRNRNG